MLNQGAGGGGGDAPDRVGVLNPKRKQTFSTLNTNATSYPSSSLLLSSLELIDSKVYEP